MTIEKIEKTVEVHQLQFSYQVVDVELSRNDECPVIQERRKPVSGFLPRSSTSTKALLYRLARTSPHESVVQEDCEFPMVQKTQGFFEWHAGQLPSINHPDSSEVFEDVHRSQASYTSCSLC